MFRAKSGVVSTATLQDLLADWPALFGDLFELRCKVTSLFWSAHSLDGVATVRQDVENRITQSLAHAFASDILAGLMSTVHNCNTTAFDEITENSIALRSSEALGLRSLYYEVSTESVTTESLQVAEAAVTSKCSDYDGVVAQRKSVVLQFKKSWPLNALTNLGIVAFNDALCQCKILMPCNSSSAPVTPRRPSPARTPLRSTPPRLSPRRDRAAAAIHIDTEDEVEIVAVKIVEGTCAAVNATSAVSFPHISDDVCLADLAFIKPCAPAPEPAIKDEPKAKCQVLDIPPTDPSVSVNDSLVPARDGDDLVTVPVLVRDFLLTGPDPARDIDAVAVAKTAYGQCGRSAQSVVDELSGFLEDGFDYVATKIHEELTTMVTTCDHMRSFACLFSIVNEYTNDLVEEYEFGTAQQVGDLVTKHLSTLSELGPLLTASSLAHIEPIRADEDCTISGGLAVALPKIFHTVFWHRAIIEVLEEVPPMITPQTLALVNNTNRRCIKKLDGHPFCFEEISALTVSVQETRSAFANTYMEYRLACRDVVHSLLERGTQAWSALALDKQVAARKYGIPMYAIH